MAVIVTCHAAWLRREIISQATACARLSSLMALAYPLSEEPRSTSLLPELSALFNSADL